MRLPKGTSGGVFDVGKAEDDDDDALSETFVAAFCWAARLFRRLNMIAAVKRD
jgi:hypothetical protein